LDYKIKDLKRDITPKMEEIQSLKQSTMALDNKLKRYNQMNSGLGLTVDDNRNRQEVMMEAIAKSRGHIRRNETYIKAYRKQVYEVARHIDDYDTLKMEFHSRLFPYIQFEERKKDELDPDIRKEFIAQKEFLRKST
jgi:predicted ferric reductase